MENTFKQTGRIGDFAVFCMRNEIDVARIVKVTTKGFIVRSLTAPADESIKEDNHGGFGWGVRFEWFVNAERTFIIPKEAQDTFDWLDTQKRNALFNVKA